MGFGDASVRMNEKGYVSVQSLIALEAIMMRDPLDFSHALTIFVWYGKVQGFAGEEYIYLL